MLYLETDIQEFTGLHVAVSWLTVPEDVPILIPELCERVPAGGGQHASSALKLRNDQTEGQTWIAQLDEYSHRRAYKRQARSEKQDHESRSR